MNAWKRRLPDLLTYARAVCVPTLWLVALAGNERLAGLVLLVAGLSDVLDGRLSRRWGVTSAVGSKVDALADTGMGISALGMLLVFEPEVVRDHPVFFVAMAIIAAILLAWCFRVFGKVADFHMTSGRAAGITAYLFLLLLFLLDIRWEPLLYLFMTLCWLLVLETIVAIRTRGRFMGRPSQVLAWLGSLQRSTGDDSAGV